tara:strand:- start:774 stop:1007 length:234 start_codon:yes stop_codon:yes gene_type:complete
MRYNIKKSKLIQYIFSDTEDLKYYARTWIEYLEEDGKIDITLQDLLDNQCEIPTYLIENYEGDMDYINEIKFITLID